MTNGVQKMRLANEGDVERILAIYAPFVTDTVVSFETVVPSLESFRERFNEICKTYPWLVYEVDGIIAGYAYASSHRSRCAYGWSADVTVYVDPKFQRMNIGRSLYSHLFEILRQQGFYNALAGIALPNPGSIGLHEAMGFTKVGVYKNIGYKHSMWHDVVWYQLELKSGGVPCDPTPITKLGLRSGNA